MRKKPRPGVWRGVFFCLCCLVRMPFTPIHQRSQGTQAPLACAGFLFLSLLDVQVWKLFTHSIYLITACLSFSDIGNASNPKTEGERCTRQKYDQGRYVTSLSPLRDVYLVRNTNKCIHFHSLIDLLVTLTSFWKDTSLGICGRAFFTILNKIQVEKKKKKN